MSTVWLPKMATGETFRGVAVGCGLCARYGCLTQLPLCETSVTVQWLSVYARLTDSSARASSDKYAALWPFIGIVAEVILLTAIIYIYEKKKSKPDMDDSDTDNGNDRFVRLTYTCRN